jgi:hypothetical protein
MARHHDQEHMCAFATIATCALRALTGGAFGGSSMRRPGSVGGGMGGPPSESGRTNRSLGGSVVGDMDKDLEIQVRWRCCGGTAGQGPHHCALYDA